MKLLFHKNFWKQYKKLTFLRKRIDERIELFEQDPNNRILENHTLSGKRRGQRSINITGDYRAIYYLIDSDTAHFIDLDTHPNLYR